MKDARILKIKRISQNSLRQMIDLEELIKYGFPALAFFVAFILTPDLNLQLRVLIVGLTGVLCWAGLTFEIDRQPAHTLIIPYFQYLLRPKKEPRVRELAFDLVDNLLIFPDRILAIYRIEPVDIMLLSQQDREIFIKNIHAFLHTHRDLHFQVLMRNRGAKHSDYTRHFDDIATQHIHLNNPEIAELRSRKLAGYLEDMKALLNKNIVPIRDYFLVLYVASNTQEAKSTIEGIQKLEALVDRVSTSLYQAKIQIDQVKEQDLEVFLKEFIRNL